MGVHTHVLEFSGGRLIATFGYADFGKFANPLRQFNGVERFALTLWALPPGLDYDEAVKAGQDALEFIQAGGTADAMTVDIRKPGGSHWGADWVRYVVGHPHTEPEPLDVEITLPHPEMVCRSEVFTTDEAADLFFTYSKTGDIPAQYALRPVQGFTKDGRNLDLRDADRPF